MPKATKWAKNNFENFKICRFYFENPGISAARELNFYWFSKYWGGVKVCYRSPSWTIGQNFFVPLDPLCWGNGVKNFQKIEFCKTCLSFWEKMLEFWKKLAWVLEFRCLSFWKKKPNDSPALQMLYHLYIAPKSLPLLFVA